MRGRPKKDIKEIKKFVEEQGYNLLSTEYVNAYIKLKFRCPENHDFEIGLL